MQNSIERRLLFYSAFLCLVASNALYSANAGLKNFGDAYSNMCFMNAGIQLLSHVKPFRLYLRKKKNKNDIERELNNIIYSIRNKKTGNASPLRKLLDTKGLISGLNNQQDCGNFVTNLLDYLYQSGFDQGTHDPIFYFKKKRFFTYADCLQKVMLGKPLSTSKFFLTKDESQTFSILSLAGGRKRNSKCQTCNKKEEGFITFSYDPFPQALFFFFSTNAQAKRQAVKEFTITQKYVDQGVFPKESAGATYRIKGIIYNRGGTDNGHYWAYAKDDSGKWFKYNDSIVTSLEEGTLFKETKHKGTFELSIDDGGEAYMLLYVRDEQDKLKQALTIFKSKLAWLAKKLLT